LWVDQIRDALPELPAAKRARFITEYGLSAYTVGVLTAERSVADFYEAAVESSEGTSPVKIANWLSSDLFGLLSDADLEFDQSNVDPGELAKVVSMVEAGAISAASGKSVLRYLVTEGGTAESTVEEKDLSQIQDQASIRAVVNQVLSDSPGQVADYLAGKKALSEWFLGQVMRATQGKADPAAVRTELDAALHDLEERQSSR
jgi:aspartyl-tRNA(Asn)/glutamyl-tRNA(Gln) amidotransferase subunit B